VFKYSRAEVYDCFAAVGFVNKQIVAELIAKHSAAGSEQLQTHATVSGARAGEAPPGEPPLAGANPAR
jgi:hypothetical protein